MKFIKLLMFDFWHGTFKNPAFLVAVLVFPVLFCIDATVRITAYAPLIQSQSISFADYFSYIYGGMYEYIPGSANPFYFPVVWIILILSPAFATLNYPFRDIQTFGLQILYRARSRNMWWFSKCVWNVFTTLMYHGFYILVIFIFCVLLGIPLGSTVNQELLSFTLEMSPESLTDGFVNLNLQIILVPVLISMAFNLFQMTLSLFLKPVFSFLFISAVSVSSAYLFSPFLIGNYAMAARSNIYVTNGFDPFVGLIIALVLLLVSGIAGIVRFYYYDILNIE